MSTSDKLEAGVQQFLEPGEQVLASIVASARGHAAQMASHGLSGTGGKGKAYAAAADAGLKIASPMGLVITSQRLITLKIGMIIGLGIGGSVKGLLGALPLTEIGSIETHRVGLSKVVDVTANGVGVTLEASNNADVDGLIAAFEAARAVRDSG